MITEAHGIPLAVSLTGSNRNDVTQLMPLIEAIPPVHGRRGRPRRCPEKVYADRGYDHDKYRSKAQEKGITPVIARRATEHGSGLGVHRWVIEQSIALLHWFRRLRIRRGSPPTSQGLCCATPASCQTRTHPARSKPPSDVILLGPLSPPGSISKYRQAVVRQNR